MSGSGISWTICKAFVLCQHHITQFCNLTKSQIPIKYPVLTGFHWGWLTDPSGGLSLWGDEIIALPHLKLETWKGQMLFLRPNQWCQSTEGRPANKRTIVMRHERQHGTSATEHSQRLVSNAITLGHTQHGQHRTVSAHVSHHRVGHSLSMNTHHKHYGNTAQHDSAPNIKILLLLLQPFCGPLHFVCDYRGEPVPER